MTTPGSKDKQEVATFLSDLKVWRRDLEQHLVETDTSQRLSLSRYVLHRKLTALIESHGHGVCIDAGSGHSPYRARLGRHAERVFSVDIEDRAGKIDLIADLQQMGIRDGVIDTVLCSQVLEHVPRPWEAISEIDRILKTSGCAIISVPHLSAIHEAPHDYFRYTEYGLRAMLSSGNLEIVELHRAGGLISFLAHYGTIVFVSLAASIRLFRPMILWLNYIAMVRLLEPVDRVLGVPKIFPCNYVVLARKTEPT